MNVNPCKALLLASAMVLPGGVARAQDGDQGAQIAQLQREVAELRAQVRELAALAARQVSSPGPAVQPAPLAQTTAAPATGAPAAAPAPHRAAAAPAGKHWYEKLTLRGYTQLRVNEIVSGDATAPAGVSRLRSVQDSGLNDKNNFSIRRARLVVQGDISNRVSLYLQGDLASAVSNQSGTERREGFFQMRDAYADVFLDRARTFKLRLGQSKVPVGWENLQSSSNRLPLDRSDAINSAVPGERDLGVVAYYTPPHVQHIWDRLAKDGQKLFGNYGAFGVGVFNGQGINRTESNNSLMTVAMATLPVEIGGGQVIELGGSLMHNRVQPEVRSGGVSPVAFADERVSLHGMLYPQPFGLQAEWTWGKAPAWDPAAAAIAARRLHGGYVMASYRLAHGPAGPIMPFARWQTYRGGWKAATNAPFLSTDELELGVEWQPLKELELTLSYGRVRRTEADERRAGLARGQLVRGQVQWNY